MADLVDEIIDGGIIRIDGDVGWEMVRCDTVSLVTNGDHQREIEGGRLASRQ